MKRLLTFLLSLTMVMALLACGKQEAPQQNLTPVGFDNLQVGFGKAKIQPPDPAIHLTGGGDPNRIATGVLDELFITCIAVTDTENNTALLYTVDIQNFSPGWSEPAREFISERTGIPYEYIFFACTHTHSVPGLNRDTEANRKFCDVFEAGLIKSTDDALADRSDAEIQVGSATGQLEDGTKLAFVRHWIMNDGSVYGSNFGDSASGYAGHPYDADIEAQLIKFVRPAADKKDVLMINWPCHSTFNGTSTKLNLSADWPSPTRDYIEANSDCLVGIFLSGAGNQIPNSFWVKEDHHFDYREYGAALGQIIVDALPNTRKINAGIIKTTQKEFTSPTNKFTDEEVLAKARDAYQYFLDNGQTKGTAYAKTLGFMSCYEARAYVWRSGLGDTISLNMQVMSIGELSFAFAPYEMFSRSAQHVKNDTPFEMTFVMAYVNGISGYIPTTEGYEYNNNVGCYEAYSSSWPKGAAEKLSTEYLNMLAELKN